MKPKKNVITIPAVICPAFGVLISFPADIAEPSPLPMSNKAIKIAGHTKNKTIPIPTPIKNAAIGTNFSPPKNANTRGTLILYVLL